MTPEQGGGWAPRRVRWGTGRSCAVSARGLCRRSPQGRRRPAWGPASLKRACGQAGAAHFGPRCPGPAVPSGCVSACWPVCHVFVFVLLGVCRVYSLLKSLARFGPYFGHPSPRRPHPAWRAFGARPPAPGGSACWHSRPLPPQRLQIHTSECDPLPQSPPGRWKGHLDGFFQILCFQSWDFHVLKNSFFLPRVLIFSLVAKMFSLCPWHHDRCVRWSAGAAGQTTPGLGRQVDFPRSRRLVVHHGGAGGWLLPGSPRGCRRPFSLRPLCPRWLPLIKDISQVGLGHPLIFKGPVTFGGSGC